MALGFHVSTDPDEVRLYCYSEQRAEKERGIVERFAARFETALTQLNDGLARPRAHKRLGQVWQRLGRLKAKHSRVASHYQIAVTADETGEKAVAVTWTRLPEDGSMATHPGVYWLRSSQTDWDEDTLWRTYTTLTDVEAVFRALKSELGLRPIYHHKPRRADGHLFITVIAYQLVQVIRTRLRAHGEHASWTTLRRILEGQQRVTATFRRPDGRTLHVRTATQAEPNSGPSTTRSASTRSREASARRPSDRPVPGLRAFVVPLEHSCRRKPLIPNSLEIPLLNLG